MCIGTGVVVAFVAMVNQSRRMVFTNAVIRTLPLLATRACCSMEKRCDAPYNAGVVLRRVPRRRLHFVIDVRFCCIMVWSSVCRCSVRCDGSNNVKVCVSIFQPSICFWVEKAASPLAIFLLETTA